MIVIRRLFVLAATAALFCIAAACSALTGTDHEDAIETRVADLVDVMGADDARALEVSTYVQIDGERAYNTDGFGMYYAMFGDDCWTTVVFGRLNEDNNLEYGWAGQLPGDEEGEDLQPIDNAGDMVAFAAASCTNSAATPDSP